MDRSVERRLAAILITDVVGYSRMISADETGTLRRLKALRRDVIDPRIAAARGRIVKSTGDGVLAEFPSTVRAVTCAVEIQRATALHNAGLPDGQTMHMRIGINLGDVIAEPDGDLYGDGVNVAARLEPLAEPGGLCVSRSVHDQVRDRLPYRFEDRGKLELKNITRPVGVFALSAATVRDLPELAEESGTPSEEVESAAVLPSQPIGSPPRNRARWPIALSGVLVIATVGAGLGWWARPKASLADKTLAVQAGLPVKPLPPLSLVVLPFANLSNDPEQDFFADGLTEDLTTDLSHLSGSFVIARNTAFTYKGKPVDVKQLGRDLGVRYALEGSVRRSGEQVVLNAQLISTETGAHVWADRFEGERSRLGELQVEFVARLARSLDIQITQAEGLRIIRETAVDPTAADLVMVGWSIYNRPRTKANMLEARRIFESALKIDQNLIPAKLGLARTVSTIALSRWSDDLNADVEIADQNIEKIVAFDPRIAMAQFVKGDVLRVRRELEQAEAAYVAAIESDRNLAAAYATLGLTKILEGSSKEAISLVSTALRLSPRDPLSNVWKFWMCHSYTHQSNWLSSIEWCNRSISDGPYWMAYVDLAVASAWAGRKDDAGNAIKHLLNLMPGYTVQKWAHADWSRNPVFLEEYQRLIEGLRMAGLPEGESN